MWYIIAQVALVVIQRWLFKKPVARSDGKLEFPEVEEGTPIPIVFGTQEVAPHVVWYGDVGKGSTDHPVWYARVHGVLCWGPVDAVHAINFDKRPSNLFSTTLGSAPFWRADGNDELFQRWDIYSPTMFGGTDQEGGPYGPLVFWWGAPGGFGFGTQESDIVTGLYNDDYDPDGPGGNPPVDPAEYSPRYPGVCHLVFGRAPTDGLPFSVSSDVELFAWSRNSPYAKPVTVLLSRFPNPPALGLSAADPMTPSLDSDVNLGLDCNPIAALYELMTDPTFGVGVPEGQIDVAKWQAAAQQMVTEGFGLSFTLHDAKEAAAAIEELLAHIDAVLRENPRTGLVEVKLLRNDYVVGNLPVIDKTNARELSASRSFWPETFNEVRVRFDELLINADRKGMNPAAVNAQNLANWQATGSARGDDAHFPMVTKAALANIIAQRRLRAASLPLMKVSWRMNREGFDLMRGDPVVLTWPDAGVQQVVLRILSIDYGTWEDREIQVDAIEDVFGIAEAVYVEPPPSSWTTPVVSDISDTPP